MKGLDTNVLLRIFTSDDQEQAERARRYLQRQGAQATFYVNRIVICELAWVLSRLYRRDWATVGLILERLLRSRRVRVDDYHTVQTALYLYLISRADFADYLIGPSNGFHGCTRTATIDRRAAELDEFELI